MDTTEVLLRLLDVGWLPAYVARWIPRRFAAMVDTDDLMQDIFVAAYESKGGFHGDDPDAFECWLRGVADRILLEAIRTARTAQRGGNLQILLSQDRRRSSTTDLFQRLASNERTPSGVFSDEQAAKAVRIAVAGLQPDRRRVIEMFHFEGKSRKEIAAAMHTSKAAVGSLVYRATKDLRGLFRAARRHLDEAPRRDGPPGD